MKNYRQLLGASPIITMHTTKQKQFSFVSEEKKSQAEEQIKSLQKEVKYDLRDFPISYIVEKFRGGLFYIPKYQREFIWREHHRTGFIESVILGLPIPMMFVADVEDGRLEIVDGAQRIQTLEAFLSGDLELRGLSKLANLDGFRFGDLPVAQQRKFESKALRIVVLEDTTTEEIRYEIFKRINTSGEKARASEVRRGAYSGAFMKFVEKCAGNSLFGKLCPTSETMRKRREPEELVLRFFAYSDSYTTFRHDVEKFLDSYVEGHFKSFDKQRMEREFTSMLTFVEKYFPTGFAKDRNSTVTPRVRFEAISVGVNLALRARPNLVPPPIDWLDTAEFQKHTTTHASNSLPRLKGRVEYVRDQLLRS